MAEYIDRDAVCSDCKNQKVCVDKSVCPVGRAPAADVEVVKRGRWLPQVLLGQRVVDCSECKTLGSPHWKRCPVCEAKMEVTNGLDQH